MRTLIKGYTFTAGTRSIDCSNANPFDIENIRLIVNETQKVGICSSMQKDLIVSIIDGVITYSDTLPLLAEDDKLTIEIDYSYNISSGLMNKGLVTNGQSTMEILTSGGFAGVSFQIDDNVIETISRTDAFAYMKDLTAVTMSNLKAITSDGAFRNCSNLTTVSLPMAQSIGGNAFNYCLNLTTLSLPIAQTLGNSAFSGCSNLTTVSLPMAQTIGAGAFQNCSNVIILSLPMAQTIGDSAIRACSNLTILSLPMAQSIDNSAFYSCSNLTTVSFPMAQTIGQYTFLSCSNVTNISLPMAQTIGAWAFHTCSNLTTITFGKLTSFGSTNTFANCYMLSNIIIGADTNINLDFSSLSNTTWNANIDASVWNENFVSGIINNLFDFTSGVAHTIKLGAFPYAKLTPETIALAAAKNWNITS